MDEFTLLFGRHRVLGCPWHGRVEAGVLTLPNATTIGGFGVGARGALRLQVPGTPAVVRTPEEAAADTIAGRQWRTDAAISLTESGTDLYLYGARLVTAQIIYAVGPGNCWGVKMPPSVIANSTRTALVDPSTFNLISRLEYLPEEEAQSIQVALQGYADDPIANPVWAQLTWDSLPDGSRAVLGRGSLNSRFGYSMPAALTGFAELRCSGLGTPESPFAAVLELLSGVNGVAEQSAEDNMTTWTGVWGWQFTVDQEYFEVPEQPCPSIRETYTESNFFLDPAGIPSVNTPATSITTGNRKASVKGYVLGYWYAPSGERQAVTLDITYDLTSDFLAEGVGTGSPPRVIEIEQALGAGSVCAPTTTVELIEDGSYEWQWEATHTTSEDLLIVLRVGGTEIDRQAMRYEYSQVQEYKKRGPVGVNNGPGASDGTVTTESRLLLNGEVFDSVSAESPSGSGLSALISPTRRIDPTSRFDSGPPNDWLTGLSTTDIRLDDGYTHIWRCYVHWWSNHLVCLREETKSLPNLRLNDRYGFTAYPGGVTATRITSNAPSAFAHAPPLYGSRNPLTGFVELGKTQPFSFV